jgi:hypothetical protein
VKGILRIRLLDRQRLPLSVNLEASQAVAAAMEAARHLVGLPVRRPAPASLDRLRTALATAREAGQPPAHWPLGLLRGAGWIILEPAVGGRPAADPVLLAGYLAALERRG